MKKILSLLSVLTISGTAVPTTIAASPYQKEETIKNIDINYQQTNNLENLNRNKRWNKEINVFNHLPNSVKKTWNSRSPRIDIKRQIFFNSTLPTGINPDVLKLSDLTSTGTTVKINTTFNGDTYSGSKYVNFN